MNIRISGSFGLAAVLYFTANFNAQTKVIDSVPKENKIDEIVMIGYGGVKKQNLTSAVSSVKADAFDNRPIYSVGQALQGQAAGVNVIQASGKPGAALDVKIRGNNSISSSVSPLYVVDGIQTNDITGLNPDDIVDMTILKDASSTAIYGINGSSGVVIITTKRGKQGKPQLNFNAYWGISKTVKNIDVLNLDQYKTLMADIQANGGSDYLSTVTNPRYAGIDTDWRKEVFQTGFDQNYNVNYAFGNEKVKAYTALGYQDIEGIIKPAHFQRTSVKVNLDAVIAPWLKLNSSVNYYFTSLTNTNDNLSTARGGVVLSAFNTPSFLPVYGTDVNFIPSDGVVYDQTTGQINDGYKPGQFAPNPYQSSWENPVAYQSRKDKTQTQRFLSNLGLDVKVLKNLVWKPSISFDMTDSRNTKFTDGFQTSYGRSKSGIGSQEYIQYQEYNFENTLTYTLKKGVHDFSLLGGAQITQKSFQNEYFAGEKFPEGIINFDYEKAATQGYDKHKDVLRNASFFGRALYTYDGKYTLMGVFRYNGSSNLAPEKKWGFFPGVSASWLVSKEDFLADSKVISELKLRGGWGQTGNVSGVPAYSHFNIFDPYWSNGIPAYTFKQYDSDVTWETTTDTNVGLDLGLFNNRIRFTTDLYKRKTTDLIFPYVMGNLSGPIYRNAGSLENKGIEFSLNTANIKNENFTWNTSFNISFAKNKILNFEQYLNTIDVISMESVGGKVIRFQPGHALSTFYGYKVDHVDPNTGNMIYKDLNGNGYQDVDDRTFIGNPNPKYTFGFSNNFTLKNWYMDVLITGSVGNDVFNATRFDLEMMNDYKNQSTAVLNRWTTPGQITDVPRANSASAQEISDRFVEDGSYVKLKAVTLGYNFNNPFKGVSKLNVYVTGQNLLTITDYSGMDPEVNAFTPNRNTSGAEKSVFGIDYGTYPQVRTFIIGLKANF
ncbi:SusC/RagA family TonB-linked outer membrane protein [Chryseobacterium sp. 2987]|uniref:SusC/RagA family TonB-linked outer membrane protein n=1 Tax=Chryseobacterium sp. 2987 TaxID=2817767 RepID=UPI0028658C23|nr:SusC/RagA family TonB-linked outer membrane protein [Chryseobacterium sp. 2987]MDR6922338.1 TonB-linked SusC/RagA family outer membrane protein [Chryseobacterium sp. 2987]